jgi:hypothetical protein
MVDGNRQDASFKRISSYVPQVGLGNLQFQGNRGFGRDEAPEPLFLLLFRHTSICVKA